jgi:subtilisin family serine protease
MRRAILLITVMATAVLLAFGGVALAQQGGRTTTEDPPASFKAPNERGHAPNKLIVKIRDDATEEELEEFNRRQGASIDKVLAPNLVPGLVRVSLPAALEAREAVGLYRAFGDVIEYAELDSTQYAAKTSNDPYYANNSLWGLKKIQADFAWDVIDGQEYSGVTSYKRPLVTVTDTGVQIQHPDLKDNVWTNYNEWQKTAGVDDSPNSTNPDNHRIDDFYGWDEYQDNNSVYDNLKDDHGTHVAGTIGAKGNNKTGVVGVNWMSEIAACKFLGPAGGYTSDAIRCLDYEVAELESRVSNNSWGGGSYSQGLYDALKRARDYDFVTDDSSPNGHLFVAAASNDGTDNDTTPRWPTNYNHTASVQKAAKAAGIEGWENLEGLDNVISVASTTKTDDKSSFSNYGKESVHLAAPGSGIYSTVPKNTYKSYSGTSMATPHVTGTIALMWAANPSLSPQQVKDILIHNAKDDVTSLYDKTVSDGRLNACKAVAVAAGQDPTTLTNTCPDPQ